MLVAGLFEMLLHVIQEVRVNDNNLEDRNQELLLKKGGDFNKSYNAVLMMLRLCVYMDFSIPIMRLILVLIIFVICCLNLDIQISV